MSNSTIVPGVSAEDISVLNSVLIAVGAAAKSLSHLRTIDAVHHIAQFFNDTPNFTNESLAQFMGTDVHHIDLLTNIAGDMDELVGGIQWADSLGPLLPHRNDSSAMFPAIFIVFSIFTIIVLILRLYSRWAIVWEIKSYDYAIVAGFCFSFSWGLTAVIQQYQIGTYRDVWDFTFDSIKLAQVYTFALAAILYPLGILIIKTSLLLFYYELSDWRLFRWVVIGIFTFMCLSTIGGMFANIFSCMPVLYWRDYLESQCTLQQAHLLIVSGVLNIITDVAVWLCPLPLVWKLKLSQRERMLAVFTFGMGFIACVASCFRIVAIRAGLNFSSTDFSPATTSSWTVIELYLGIICASAPFLRALVLRIVRRRQSKKELRRKIHRLKHGQLSDTSVSDSGNRSRKPSLWTLTNFTSKSLGLFSMDNFTKKPSVFTLNRYTFTRKPSLFTFRQNNQTQTSRCDEEAPVALAPTPPPAMVDCSTQTQMVRVQSLQSIASHTNNSPLHFDHSNSVLYSGTFITVHASRSLWTEIPPTPLLESLPDRHRHREAMVTESI